MRPYGTSASTHSDPDLTTVSDASLRDFRSRPEFHLIRNITVGVIFLTVLPRTEKTRNYWTEDHGKRVARNNTRLNINRELLRLVCETLLQALDLQTLKLLWHDGLEHGVPEEKRDCLAELAAIPEKVKCTIFMGIEAAAVHPPKNRDCIFGQRRTLTVKECATKAELNRYLSMLRQQFQARSQRESPEESETASPNAIEQSPA